MIYRRRTFRRTTRRPRRYIRRTYKRRTPNKRRSNALKPYVKVNRAMPVPDRQYIKMRYVDVINNRTVTAGLLNLLGTDYYYRSSLFSPRGDGSGHQPMWYDQFAGHLFQMYCVHGIGYKITLNHRASDSAFYLVVRHQNTTTQETSLQTVMERNDVKRRVGGGWAGSKGLVTVSGYMSVAKTLGVSPREIGTEDSYSAGYGVNPAIMAYLFPYVATSSSTDAVFDASVELIFYCSMFKRSFPGSS